MRLEIFFLGSMICITIVSWLGMNKWSSISFRNKFFIIYVIGMITMILGLFSGSVNAYVDCNQTGYKDCVEQTELIKGVNLTSKLAMNLYDEEGDVYENFALSGFAVGGFYADIYYEGQELYINKNLTGWDEACNNDSGIMICKGEMIRTTNGIITLQLGRLHEEYVGCPLFISKACDDDVEWCEWAGMGWMKETEYGCPHIRVTECFYDEDCLPEQYCDKTDKYDWKKWSCKTTPNSAIILDTRTTRDNSRGYTNNKPTKAGYSPEYDINDAKTSFIDLLIGIIKGIGGWFS